MEPFTDEIKRRRSSHPRRHGCFGVIGVGDQNFSRKLPTTAHQTDSLSRRFCRNFDYPEQREVDKYYPQYYHRTDKVSRAGINSGLTG